MKAIDKKKQTGAHFTPKALAAFVAERLNGYVIESSESLRILDPACGDGNLLEAMSEVLPNAAKKRCTLIGIENDPDSYHELNSRLSNSSFGNTDFIMGDFLDYINNTPLFPEAKSLEPVDVIIANPPYVRTQILGASQAQALSSKFNLNGRLDLYQAFIAAMIDVLSPGGMLGIITSNRFLTTKSGASSRRFLRSQLDEMEIIDLGDTKLFDAAVLPALIFGKRRSTPRPKNESVAVNFSRIYSTENANEKPRDVPSIFSILQSCQNGNYRVNDTVFEFTQGKLAVPTESSVPWAMHTASEKQWVHMVDTHTYCRIQDVAKVRVGIKTTADKVFIRDNWQVVPNFQRPEDIYLYPLLSQRNAAKWSPVDSNEHSLRVLYTHEIKNGKRSVIDFPKNSSAWAYLQSHRERLESRKYVIRAGRRWYEIWVPQDPANWKSPKIVFPDISPNAKFFYDNNGSIVDGNCYWITTKDCKQTNLLKLILGIANSSTIERYHELCFQNKLYANRRRYLTQYVQQYPLPNPESGEAMEIISCVDSIIHAPEKRLAALQIKLDTIVAKAFGVTAS